jgi:hypothetical protein
MDEIRSVFKRPFRDQDFSFDILQHGGGKFKSLVIPSLSSSFSWTASAVAGSSKSPIYILTRTNIGVSMHGIAVASYPGSRGEGEPGYEARHCRSTSCNLIVLTCDP